MQKFEMPKMSVEEFEIVDVIMTASFVEECITDGLGPNDMPIM